MNTVIVIGLFVLCLIFSCLGILFIFAIAKSARMADDSLEVEGKKLNDRR